MIYRCVGYCFRYWGFGGSRIGLVFVMGFSFAGFRGIDVLYAF